MGAEFSKHFSYLNDEDEEWGETVTVANQKADYLLWMDEIGLDHGERSKEQVAQLAGPPSVEVKVRKYGHGDLRFESFVQEHTLRWYLTYSLRLVSPKKVSFWFPGVPIPRNIYCHDCWMLFDERKKKFIIDLGEKVPPGSYRLYPKPPKGTSWERLWEDEIIKNIIHIPGKKASTVTSHATIFKEIGDVRKSKTTTHRRTAEILSAG